MRIHNLVLVIAIPAMALAQSDRVRPAPPPVKVVPLEKIVDTKPMTPATGGVVVVTGAGCVLSVVAVPTDGPPVAGQITSTGPLRWTLGLTDQPIEITVDATSGACAVRLVPPVAPAAPVPPPPTYGLRHYVLAMGTATAGGLGPAWWCPPADAGLDISKGVVVRNGLVQTVGIDWLGGVDEGPAKGCVVPNPLLPQWNTGWAGLPDPADIVGLLVVVAQPPTPAPAAKP